MGRREFAVRDILEVYSHWQHGQSIRQMARSLGLDRNTIRKYIRAAEDAGYRPDTPRSKDEWVAFIKEKFPETIDSSVRSSAFPKIDVYHDLIRERLAKNTVATVWRRLRDEAGLNVSLSSFRRYVNSRFPDIVYPESITVLRPDVPPGKEAQVDFGYMGMLADPIFGKRHKAWAFIMVLAYSRHMFVKIVLKLNQLVWTECHIHAFEFFGGVPARLVLDNLKGGVIKADLYDPQFNRVYAEMADHYGVLIDPCRAGHPKDKPRVERMVSYVRDSFWCGRDFANVYDANREAIRWCKEVAGLRIHGTTHRRPLEMFESEEKPYLRPLPEGPWEHVEWRRAKVAPDCCISVCKSLYSVPYRYRGKTVDVRLTKDIVQCYLNEELIKTHIRVPEGRRQIDPNDLPEDKRAFFERCPQWCMKCSREIGKAVGEAVETLLSTDTTYRLREAQGIIRLAERYGALRLNAACERACKCGDLRYKTIKTILEKGLDRIAIEELPDHSADIPAFLHGQQQFDWAKKGFEEE